MNDHSIPVILSAPPVILSTPSVILSVSEESLRHLSHVILSDSLCHSEAIAEESHNHPLKHKHYAKKQPFKTTPRLYLG